MQISNTPTDKAIVIANVYPGEFTSVAFAIIDLNDHAVDILKKYSQLVSEINDPFISRLVLIGDIQWYDECEGKNGFDSIVDFLGTEEWAFIKLDETDQLTQISEDISGGEILLFQNGNVNFITTDNSDNEYTTSYINVSQLTMGSLDKEQLVKKAVELTRKWFAQSLDTSLIDGIVTKFDMWLPEDISDNIALGSDEFYNYASIEILQQFCIDLSKLIQTAEPKSEG